MCKLNILPSRRLAIFAVFCVCSGPFFASAQIVWDNAEEIPPWMEKVGRGGRSTYLIPRGAKVEEVTAGFVKVEPPAEYVARQVYEMDKRQAAMEKELVTIKNELAELREQCALQQQNSNEKAP